MRKNKNILAPGVWILLGGACLPAAAATEEVTFSGTLEADPVTANPSGPAPVSVTGYFYFDTTQVSYGGLTPAAAGAATVPGSWGPGIPLVDVQFSVGEAGFETITYADGSKVTIPYAGVFGFAGGLFNQCGSLGDCAGWIAGQQLTLAQFNASSDPWAQIVNGMTGSSDTFSFHSYPQESGAQPDWLVVGGLHFAVNAVSVPEPSVLALLVLGMGALALTSARRPVVRRR